MNFKDRLCRMGLGVVVKSEGAHFKHQKGAQPGLGTQLRYEAPRDLRVKS